MRQSAFYFDVAKLTDDELADLLHELHDDFSKRLQKYEGLAGQIQASSLMVRSYGTTKQKMIRGT